MNTPSCADNPYGVTFQIHDHPRDQLCVVCDRIISSGNHIITITDRNGQMAYLGKEEPTWCCGKEYWTFASYHAEFQARIAIETYTSMLQTAHLHGIVCADVVPIVAHNFIKTDEHLLH